ncbi:GNAT family N-acetyltransferase [Fontibacillus sp. BL9]|uniref:GNAT family N-acetyltransferase n=1 Tax=Fontibacillus sp. BL9 TaxID=3389971 RepID=UPI00397A81D5
MMKEVNCNVPAVRTRLQTEVYELLHKHSIFEILKDYDPILVGTVPLDIQVPGSDLDIICEVHDFALFEEQVNFHFGHFPEFKVVRRLVEGLERIKANFIFEGWPVELFGQPMPTRQQNGYRHMLVEARMLKLYGEPFKLEIISLKQSGLKTEPAFARLLNLEGDPYQQMLAWEHRTDGELLFLWKGARDMSLNIRTEAEGDYKAVDDLLVSAFEGRRDEAELVDRIRKSAGFIPELSLVAEKQGSAEILGHILLSKAQVRNETETYDVLVLAPLAVKPAAQRQGVGGQLMREGISRAKQGGHGLILLIGHPAYYPNFGFVPAGQYGLELHQFDVPPEVFMVRELQSGELSRIRGELQYPPAFFG